jgi:hypothetical protein
VLPVLKTEIKLKVYGPAREVRGMYLPFWDISGLNMRYKLGRSDGTAEQLTSAVEQD